MTAPLIVLAAGGTGGHMFPAQALAESLLAGGYRVHLFTDARGARYTGAFPEGVRIRQMAAATTARGGILAKMAAPFRILKGGASARRAMMADRPVAVVGFGGYPSVPALIGAVMLRIPRAIHEQNGVLGRVNRLFATRVDAVACGTWPTDLPAGIDGVHTGNPVRASVLARAATPYDSAARPRRILVIGGSQGARILSDVVPKAIAAVPDARAMRVSHQARAEDADRVRAAYAAAAIDADVQSFFADVPDRMADAQLIVSRAGASSVADITVIGRPSILIPFAAAAGDHQSANARGLVDEGGATMIAETDLTSEGLAHAMTSILSDPSKAKNMAAAALAQGRPDATDRLVGLIESLLTPPQAKERPDV